MIHERAIVSPDARVHGEVTIGPYAIISADVEIGAGTRIEAHVVVKGPTVIGADNHIFQFASIGDDPQDKKYAGESTTLTIGDRNTIRECCTITVERRKIAATRASVTTTGLWLMPISRMTAW